MRPGTPAVRLLPLSLFLAACGPAVPATDSPEYTETVRAFYTGLAAVQSGDNDIAAAAFDRTLELAPGEPAGWANRGLVALLGGRPDSAATLVDRALGLAPDDARLELLSALVARDRGDEDGALAHFRRAAELDPGNPRILYLLATTVEAQDRPGSVEEAGSLLDRVLAAAPGNRAALVERARLAAKAADADALQESLTTLAGQAGLPAEAAERLEAVREAAGAGQFARAATELAFFQTALQAWPPYRRDRDALVLSPARTELLVSTFSRMAMPVARPAPADTTLRFERRELAVGGGPARWVRALWLDEETPLVIAAAQPDGLWVGTESEGRTLAVPGVAELSPAAVGPTDYDYDFRTDVAVAGPDGLRLFRSDGGLLTPAPAGTLPPTDGAFVGVWAADLDLEGDLDLVAARAEGPPLVLQNRGDGRFEAVPELQAVDALRAWAWADLDLDGDPDAAMLDADGRLHVFLNRRLDSPRFEAPRLPTDAPVDAMAVADLDQDATLELLVLEATGTLARLEWGDGAWATDTVAAWTDYVTAGPGSGASLFVEDLDNNGRLDILASSPSGSHLWLGTGDGVRDHGGLPVRVTDVADVNGEGRLDLLGVDADGPVWLTNHGDRDYYATTLRPRAATVTGDRRINTYGIGGEIEVRAGLLYQKQPIQGPGVHFGLGEWPQADVARIVWPNGSVQAEFNVSGTSVSTVARQRLKGSCPWIFTYDGQGMRFVTDFLWRTALGLRINAQGDVAVMHGEDWVRIPGDALAPRDGAYDVRITAELWETHFFDHVALLVVDHPVGTEVLVDERFTLPAPVPALHVTGPLQPLAGAVDHRGSDAMPALRELDEAYLDTFRRGPHQGVAEDHFVEVSIPDDAPAAGPLWLVASGWIYPTDSSINVAIAQGEFPALHGLRIEVPDGAGGWTVIEPDYGFPSGKTKTILLDLEGAFPDPSDRRVRMHTNMEVYWDRIAWAVGRPDATVRTRRLLPETAELRYRGFSEVHQAGRAAPELPTYRVAGTAPAWQSLEGYYTRFGDVTALNEAVDDRYVIMNSGDELAFRFPAVAPPAQGWTRDFVLIGDGWIKDGDLNTGFSHTIRPLPYHGLSDYDEAPGPLRDEPAYRANPGDWRSYHTRYVNSDHFQHALLPPDSD